MAQRLRAGANISPHFCLFFFPLVYIRCYSFFFHETNMLLATGALDIEVFYRNVEFFFLHSDARPRN